MHDCWDQMVDGVLVEVLNTDLDVGRDVKVYWIATVLKIYGQFLLSLEIENAFRRIFPLPSLLP